MKAFLIAALLLLGGCATCREHPVACTVAGAIVAGSVAATIEQHHHAEPGSRPEQLPFVRPIVGR
jgi:hypothetical protein